MAKNFAITGATGYIAPRHLQAINETGHTVVAALDPSDSAGTLDRYSFDVRFFTEFERFERRIEKLRRLGDTERVHCLSVCSPNYLHDAHCRLALRIGADAICEKPLVINPWNLDALQQLEAETGRRIWTVLQLRLHDALIGLREQLRAGTAQHDVVLPFVTERGASPRTSACTSSTCCCGSSARPPNAACSSPRSGAWPVRSSSSARACAGFCRSSPPICRRPRSPAAGPHTAPLQSTASSSSSPTGSRTSTRASTKRFWRDGDSGSTT